MITLQDKLLTKTDCNEAGDYVVPNVLNPRDLGFRPDIGHKLYPHHTDIMPAFIKKLNQRVPVCNMFYPKIWQPTEKDEK